MFNKKLEVEVKFYSDKETLFFASFFSLIMILFWSGRFMKDDISPIREEPKATISLAFQPGIFF